jgi:hypothetical protein
MAAVQGTEIHTPFSESLDFIGTNDLIVAMLF